MALSHRLTAVALGALALAALPLYRSQAQVSLSLYPVSFRLDIPRGSSQSGVVTVTNPSGVPLEITPELENFTGSDGGSVEYAPEGSKYGLISWITVDKSPFVLQPGTKRELPFTVSVPDNGPVGGHYGAVLFRAATLDAKDNAGSAVGVSGRVGSIILVSVPGEVSKSGELVKVTAPTFIQYGPLSLAASFKNTGSVHYVTKGTATFKGLFGKREVQFEEKTILPGVTRDTKATLDKHWLFGPIWVDAALVAGDGTVSNGSTFTFALPIIPTIVIVILVLLAYTGYHAFRKNFKIVRSK